MKRFASAAVLAALLMTGCTKDDRYGTRAKTGEADREIKHDAKVAEKKIKEGWDKTKEEVKDDVDKLKHETNRAVDGTNDASHRR
jgi:hypothetical protein